MKMIPIILATVSLILSLFLSSYSIRSLLFSYTARKEIQEKRLSAYNYCKSSDASVLEDNHSNKDIILNSGIKNYNTCYLHINNSFTKRITSTRVNGIDYPFVSIVVATHNERLVIDRLMKSCAALTYKRDKFEIIVVDDSEDGTFDVLVNWKQSIPNLKVMYRNDRAGWKGGALNLALKNINVNSSYVLVLDADTILVNDILERFVLHFSKHNSNGNDIDVIQGYPIARVFNYNNTNLNSTNINWVARGVEFRLAQRNIIEFLAKDRINLPIQITGNLFMIRSDLIKQFEFSNDLCEDWKLTLDIYYHDIIISSYGDEGNYNSCRKSKSKKILFDPLLVSYCEAPIKLASYFRQRMRVSEGHTRAFRTNLIKILSSKMGFINKMEFFIIGIQYTKFMPLLALIIIEKYNIRDSFYLLLLNLFTMPAFVIGSLRGLFRKDGIFYKTERNS